MSVSLRMQRRIERLEVAGALRRDCGIRAAVTAAALGRLSTPDLMALIEASDSELPYEGWSAAQIAAGEALRAGMEEECVLAGFTSTADFNRRYPERPVTA
jgi:hypothetical protein